jgi:hypothetical protein
MADMDPGLRREGRGRGLAFLRTAGWMTAGAKRQGRITSNISRAEDWPWSSARAHLAGEDDELATVAPLRALIPDFAALLTAPADPATMARIERAPTIGRPLEAPEWVAALERRLGRPLHPANPAQRREWTRTLPGNHG